MQIPRRRWFYPRFSLRTLTVLVSAVCCYLGCWELTKHFGIKAVEEFKLESAEDRRTILVPSSPAPFIVGVNELRSSQSNRPSAAAVHRRYYCWFLGWTLETPCYSSPERDVKQSLMILSLFEHEIQRLEKDLTKDAILGADELMEANIARRRELKEKIQKRANDVRVELRKK